MATGTGMAYALKFKGTVFPLHIGAWTIAGYAAVWALCVNLAITVLLTAILRGLKVDAGTDATQEADFGE
jgi:SSS family solute:Na+ symporter